MSNYKCKYELAICELYNPYFHGEDNYSDKTIKSQFLIFECVDMYSFFINDYKASLQFLLNIYRDYVRKNRNTNNLKHPVIENYSKIITNIKNYTIDIVEKDILSGGEMVAYKKTFWLRIFQKKWKNNYYKKINKFKNPKNLFLRSING